MMWAFLSPDLHPDLSTLLHMTRLSNNLNKLRLIIFTNRLLLRLICLRILLKLKLNSLNNSVASKDHGQSSLAPNVANENCDATAFAHVHNAKNRIAIANTPWIMTRPTYLTVPTTRQPSPPVRRSALVAQACIPPAPHCQTMTPRTPRLEMAKHQT